MRPDERHRFKISEEAALWLLRLEQDNSPQSRTEFAAWARLSPQHVEEFLLAKATVEYMGVVDPQRQIDLARLDESDDISAVVPLRPQQDIANSTSAVGPVSPQKKTAPRAQAAWIAALAASIAVVALTVAWLSFAIGHTQTYSTATGDQRVVKLQDGSVVYLNTGSRAEVLFTEKAREVKLTQGEALFVVEHDAARPFRVVTDKAVIQAVGTQFNVYRLDDVTRVSVVEGAVRIAPEAPAEGKTNASEALKLTAGNEAEVAQGKLVKEGKPNVERAIAWRARRLVFEADPLEVVIREFNRYQTKRPIVLEGTEIRHRTISGVFDADDPKPLVKFLEEDRDLRVTEGAGGIVISGR